MFSEIPHGMLARMQELEQIDSRDRTDGTPRMKRLRQMPAEVGKFIASVAAPAPAGRCIEIGASAGYSTL
jgi:predicted O-methyltransferase YrrM